MRVQPASFGCTSTRLRQASPPTRPIRQRPPADAGVTRDLRHTPGTLLRARGMLPGQLDPAEDGMTSIAENTASCALCRRHLLVGEPARLYQDPASKRFLKVCPLCYERAERRGWQADGTPIVAVHANPPRDH